MHRLARTSRPGSGSPLRSATALVALVLALAGCGEREFFTPEDVDVLVVDAVLTVDEPLPAVLLGRTLAPDEPVSSASAGEAGAQVEVELDDGTVFAYVESPVEKGRYVPVDTAHRVQPSRRYDLRVRSDRGELLTASTLTPPRLRVDGWVLLDATGTEVVGRLRSFDEVGQDVYTENRLDWGEGLLEARFERPAEVVAYQVSLFSLDPDSDFAIEPDFFEDEDFEEIERQGASPMFEAEGGTLRLPWFAVFFEGRYRVEVHATDRNWSDLVRTSPSFSNNGGFGGNAGDGFDRPIFHVEGGIGLFGSSSVDSVGFFVVDDD